MGLLADAVDYTPYITGGSALTLVGIAFRLIQLFMKDLRRAQGNAEVRIAALEVANARLEADNEKCKWRLNRLATLLAQAGIEVPKELMTDA